MWTRVRIDIVDGTSHEIKGEGGTHRLNGAINSHSSPTLATVFDGTTTSTADANTLAGLTDRNAGSSGIGCRSMTTASVLFVVVLGSLVGLSHSLGILLVLVDGPIEDVVILEALTNEQVTEDLPQVGVVWFVVKPQGSSVIQVDGKLVWEATAQNLSGGGHLLLHDPVVFLLLGGSLESLPGKGSTAEIEHHVTKGFHVITTRLLHAKVRVDTSITSGTGQVLVLSVGNVEMGLGITILLGQTKVDDVDLIASLANAHQEVIRFDITMDERLGMDILDAGNELIGEQEDSLQGEFAVAEIEQVLEAGSEKVQDHGIVITLGSKPTDKGNADAAGEGLVDTCFIFELWMFGFDTFKLDGDLLTRDDISSCVNMLGERRKCFVDMKTSYPGRYHQNFHCRFCVRFDTCCRHGDPRGGDQLSDAIWSRWLKSVTLVEGL